MKKILGILLIALVVLNVSACTKENSSEVYGLFGSNLIAVGRDGKYGYLDKKGNVAIEFLFDQASSFHNGTAVVVLSDKMFVIDIKGKNILPDKYDAIYKDLDEGIILYKENSRWGLMSAKGKIITEPLYAEMSAFSEGRAAVSFKSLHGFIDAKGTVIVELKYDYTGSFSNGLAYVKKDDKYGFIDKDGKVVIDLLYDGAEDFDAHGRALVYMNTPSKDSLIDKDNKTIISGDGINANGGPLYFVTTGGIAKPYDKDGKLFNNKEYLRIWWTHDYKANVQYTNEVDMNVWFNEDGSIFKEALYDDSEFVQDFLNAEIKGLAVKDGELMKVFTKKGDYQFRATAVTQVLDKEQFIVKRNTTVGIVDKTGATVVEFLYDEIVFIDGYYAYKIGGLYGLMDAKYKVIITAKYDSISIMKNIHNFWM